MMVETGLQPNCSELVVRLFYSPSKSYNQVLQELERITGWKLGVHIYKAGKEFAFPVDPQKIKLIEQIFFIEPQDAINERLLYQMLKHDITPRDLIQHLGKIRVGLIKYRRFVLGNKLTHKINIYKDHGCFIRLESPDSYVPHFEPLLKVLQARKEDASWLVTGGDPTEFLEWCKKRGAESLLLATRADCPTRTSKQREVI